MKEYLRFGAASAGDASAENAAAAANAGARVLRVAASFSVEATRRSRMLAKA